MIDLGSEFRNSASAALASVLTYSNCPEMANILSSRSLYADRGEAT